MLQTDIERVPEQIRLNGEDNPPGIVQMTKFWPYRKLESTQTRICLGKWNEQNSPGILRYKRITQSRRENQI